jgi:hypothetical protein
MLSDVILRLLVRSDYTKYMKLYLIKSDFPIFINIVPVFKFTK